MGVKKEACVFIFSKANSMEQEGDILSCLDLLKIKNHLRNVKVFNHFSLLLFYLTEADTVIASWGTPSSSSSDYSNSQTGPFAETSNSETVSLGDILAALRGGGTSSNRGYYSYSNYQSLSYYTYQPPQPIYGSTGYTKGLQGQQNLNYNEYSYHYWRYINLYRRQYYYSYTFSGYVCDTRANRNG